MNDAEKYIALQDVERQPRFEQLYKIGVELIPNVEIGTSYDMPVFKYMGKPVFYFANAKKHIGFYPTPGPIAHFEVELKDRGLKFSKGSIQLPVGKEWPQGLIRKIILFRMQEIEETHK